MSDQTGGDSQDLTSTDDPNYNPTKSKALVVPGNLLPWLEAASDETGVPVELLAAVIYQHSRFTGLTPGLVMQVATAIGNEFDKAPYVAKYPGDVTFEPTEKSWIDAATRWAYGDTDTAAAQAYSNILSNVYRSPGLKKEMKAGKETGSYIADQGVGITLGPDKTLNTGKFTTARFPGGLGGGVAYGPGGAGGVGGTLPLIPGLSDDDALAVQRIADPLFLKYLGRIPTTDEYVDLSKKRWTQQTLESHLRNQPFKDQNGAVVGGMTLGRAMDVRDLANKYANSIEGRDADESEIAWMITNGVPASDANISAFYQQVHDHAVWHGDPTDWRAAQKRVQAIWDSLGLTGKVDPNLVNQAVDGKLTDNQVTDQVRALPAPGYPVGTTVGDVDRLRTIATSAKADLFPGETVTEAELHHLIGASPDDIRSYYRSIVPKDSKTGLPAGVETDYKAMAEKVLSQYGISYELTPADLKFFALTQSDPSMMLQHFAENPKIAATHPGLAYGMSTDAYLKAVSGLQDAYGGVFGNKALDVPQPGSAKAARDNTLAGHALTEGIGPGEFSSVLETFRQETGRAPTTSEFKERRNRPTVAKPTGGASTPIAQSPDERTGRGEPRPAVGARA